MSKREVAWTTAGAAGMVSAGLAAIAVRLMLTDPLAVTSAAGPSTLLRIVHAVAAATYNMAAEVLHYL